MNGNPQRLSVAGRDRLGGALCNRNRNSAISVANAAGGVLLAGLKLHDVLRFKY